MTNNTPNAIQSMGLASGTALIAVNFTHPIETVKTRMQVGNLEEHQEYLVKNPDGECNHKTYFDWGTLQKHDEL